MVWRCRVGWLELGNAAYAQHGLVYHYPAPLFPTAFAIAWKPNMAFYAIRKYFCPSDNRHIHHVRHPFHIHSAQYIVLFPNLPHDHDEGVRAGFGFPSQPASVRPPVSLHSPCFRAIAGRSMNFTARVVYAFIEPSCIARGKAPLMISCFSCNVHFVYNKMSEASIRRLWLSNDSLCVVKINKKSLVLMKNRWQVCSVCRQNWQLVYGAHCCKCCCYADSGSNMVLHHLISLSTAYRLNNLSLPDLNCMKWCSINPSPICTGHT